MSNAASFVLCAVRRVKDHHILLNDSPLVKKACVRRVVLDKWFPLNSGNVNQDLESFLTPPRRHPQLGRDVHTRAHAQDGLWNIIGAFASTLLDYSILPDHISRMRICIWERCAFVPRKVFVVLRFRGWFVAILRMAVFSPAYHMCCFAKQWFQTPGFWCLRNRDAGGGDVGAAKATRQS